MSFSLKMISLLAPSLLLTFIPLLLPIPCSPFSVSTQAQTIPDRKAEADKLLEQGKQQANTSHYKAAIVFYESALVIYQQIRDRKGEASSLKNLGNAYYFQGAYPKAMNLYL